MSHDGSYITVDLVVVKIIKSMNAIIAPMIQHDFVTKKEFGEFRSEVNGRFDDVDARFNDIKSDMDKFKEEMKDDADRHVGQVCEQSRHDFKLATEYLEFVIKKYHEERD